MAGEWESAELGDLVETDRGISYGIVQPGQNVPDGVPIVRVADIRNGRIATDGSFRVAANIESSYSRTRLRGGELLLTLVGTVGEAAIVPDALAGWNTARAVAVIPVRRDVGAYWVQLALRSPAVREIIGARLNTTVQATLNLRDVAQLPIVLPPPQERRAIAHVLGALDDKIELNRRMAETQEAMARALFKSWFIDFDPVRAKAEGRPTGLPDALAALFPSELGDTGVPVGWKEEALHDQADWVNGAAYKNMHFSDAPDALPVVKIAELKSGVTDQTKRTNTQLGDKFRIADGELLFSWSGNPDTSIDAFIWAGGPAWLNQHVFAVRPNGKQERPFLYVMLKHFMPDFARIARDKQTTGLGHVTKADMQRMRVCVGSTQLRKAFNGLASPIFERLVGTLFENNSLETLRNTLLPRLISGELRIRDAESAIEAA